VTTEDAPVEEATLIDKAASDLQWLSVVQAIGRHAVTDAGRARIEASRPFPSVQDARLAQRRARNACTLLNHQVALAVTAFPPIGELCDILRIGGSATGRQLLDAARVMALARRLADHTHQHAQLAPDLVEPFRCAAELTPLQQRIEGSIGTDGEVLDSASPAVRDARRALTVARNRLRETSNALLVKYRDSLSGQFVAERGGRFVLPVRTDASGQVPGMVLGSSGSGSSLYVEPGELTALNNQVYLSEARLKREEAKVLAELSASAGEFVSELARAEENCVEADRLAATARWAAQIEATPVEIFDEPRLNLLQMRHPLLVDDEQSVIANDIALSAEQCLVVSGPNAGGKTVALKCLGIAVWLAQSGLPVPCSNESHIGWFDEVLTDIGDEQSISRSLSTFSAHVTRLAQYLERAKRGSLILLDEVAGGTDPDEGSALAAAVLQRLVSNGAAVATTTHYERLKRLAAGEHAQSFTNVSVGFDMQRMRPTFELHFGVPGQSSALAVAQRFGVPPDVVDAARELLPREQRHQERLLEQLENERAQLRQVRTETERELEQQRRQSEQHHQESIRATDAERDRLKKEAQALTAEVREARALVRKAKEELRRSAALADVRAVDAMISTAAGPVTLGGTLTEALAPPTRGQPLDSRLAVGSRVHIAHLGKEGEVLSAPHKGSVRVNVGGLKLSVPLEKLRRAPAVPKKTESARRARSARADTSTAGAFAPSRTSGNTCDLRGLRVDEGLDRVEAFIDTMLRRGEPAAFFLHGHGTGAMKDAVRQLLATSSHIVHWEPASEEDGGDALTVCKL